MQLVCVQAFGDHVPGDIVEVPDGAEVAHFAPPDDVQAIRAINDARAAQAPETPAAPPATEPPAAAPVIPPAASVTPAAPAPADTAEGA